MAYTYLDDGRVSTITVDGAQLASVGYDTTAEMSSVTYTSTGASVLTVGGYTKKPSGSPTGQTWTIGTRTLTETLTRSQADRITSTTTTDSAAAANTVTWAYTYDPVGRLTQAVLAAAGTRPQVSLGYGYAATGGCGADPAAGKNGSRTSMSTTIGTSPTTTSTVCTDNASRLTSVTSTTGGLAIRSSQVGYDNHGNATRIGSQTWAYDGAERVVTASQADIAPAVTLGYTRNSLGRVTTRTATSTSALPAGEAALTRYAFTGADDSPDFQLNPATGALATRFTTLPGGLLLTRTVGATSGGTWSISSLHGDVTATWDGTTLTTGYVYDPYGQPLTSTGATDPTATPTTRTATGTTDAWHGGAQRGYEHLGGLNQTLMGARTYLPALGIFTATDPIEGGNTTTYAYPQDPINDEDLSGQCPFCLIPIAIGVEELIMLAVAATATAGTVAYVQSHPVNITWRECYECCHGGARAGSPRVSSSSDADEAIWGVKSRIARPSRVSSGSSGGIHIVQAKSKKPKARGRLKGGHHEGARGSTRGKHEAGDRRRGQDQGQEKGDLRRPCRRR